MRELYEWLFFLANHCLRPFSVLSLYTYNIPFLSTSKRPLADSLSKLDSVGLIILSDT